MEAVQAPPEMNGQALPEITDELAKQNVLTGYTAFFRGTVHDHEVMKASLRKLGIEV